MQLQEFRFATRPIRDCETFELQPDIQVFPINFDIPHEHALNR